MNEKQVLEIAAQTREAAARIAGMVRRTPLLELAELGGPSGGRILLKLENTQRTGSFKIRGALNKLLTHRAQIPAAGVVAWSSGNHGIAVSEAARQLGLKAAIVVPRDAPHVKLEAIEQRGGAIIAYDRHWENRETIARQYAADTGALVVAAYDDPWVMAGQGTLAEEIREQAAAVNCRIDVLIAPCGGGGLIAGCGMSFFREGKPPEIWAVEPEQFDDTRRSLAAGKRLANESGRSTLCDSLMTAEPGQLTFPINHGRLAGVLTVSDDEVRNAIAFAWNETRTVVEPGGAAALAALLAGKLDVRGRTVAVVVSGGNIDPDLLSEALRRGGSPRIPAPG